MKIMKSVVTICLMLVMVLSFAACAPVEKTVTLRGDMTESMGMPTTDTWVLTAKGDTVQTLHKTMEVDLSGLDEETKAFVVSAVGSAISEPAKGIEGVTYNQKTEGDKFIVEITISCSGNTVKEAVDAGLLTVEDSSSRISLKQTQAALEKQGYEVVE